MQDPKRCVSYYAHAKLFPLPDCIVRLLRRLSPADSAADDSFDFQMGEVQVVRDNGPDGDRHLCPRITNTFGSTRCWPIAVTPPPESPRADLAGEEVIPSQRTPTNDESPLQCHPDVREVCAPTFAPLKSFLARQEKSVQLNFLCCEGFGGSPDCAA